MAKREKTNGAAVAVEAKAPAPPPADARVIEIAQPPYLSGETPIAKLICRSQTFAEFCAAINSAELLQRRSGEDGRKHLLRIRMRTQVKAVGADGAEIELSDADIMQMPLVYARRVKAEIDRFGAGEQPGKVIAAGNGVTTPILYRLGTPIAFETKAGDKAAIEELEFLAPTYGAAEDVLAADKETDQTLHLIRSCAVPVGSFNLQTLPSWAAAAVTMSDGFTIMEAVLPLFLEEPEA